MSAVFGVFATSIFVLTGFGIHAVPLALMAALTGGSILTGMN